MSRLRVDQLGFGYPRAGAPVLDGLTEDFPDGAITAITGPSGSGKSTLLYVVGLLLTPTSGTVWLDDQPVSALQDAERSAVRSRALGFVFQDALLDPARTALDNVVEPAVFAGLPRAGVVDRALGLLDRFGVGNRARHRPGQMSGGQAQRVALCRALLLRPAVLLGDEPTGNLDTTSSRVVWDALAEAAADGATVLLATHDDDLVRRAHHRVRVG